jgi:hypothetical protein
LILIFLWVHKLTNSNWKLQGVAKTSVNGDKKPTKIVIKCTHYDQALDVAKYIVNEMQVNCHSVTAKKIIAENEYSADIEYKKFLDEARSKNILVQGMLLQSQSYMDYKYIELSKRLDALYAWGDIVYEGHPWDHKPIIRVKFPTNGNSTKFYHKYKGYEYYYDIWSNIHYGYVGRYCKFSESTLLDGAGAAQLIIDSISKGRQVTDRSAINGSGWRKYDDVTDSLSVRLGIELFKQYPDPKNITAQILMDKIATAAYPIKEDSKIPHTCQVSSK